VLLFCCLAKRKGVALEVVSRGVTRNRKNRNQEETHTV